MRYLILVLKGMVYGVTHVAPGLGGGLVLILLGIYEQFVDALGNFIINRHKWKDYLSFLVPLGVGMVLGMLGLAKLITFLLDHYPAVTMFFFMGLLVGTIPSVLKLHGDMRLTLGRCIALLAGILLIAGVKILELRIGLGSISSLEGLGTTAGILYNALVSFLAGGASVTPGLDGSYVLLLGGTYPAVIGALAALSDLTIHWGILVSTGIGAVLGIIIFSKLIDTAIKRAPALAYYCVLGLIVSSVYGLWPQEPARTSLILLVLSFIVGALLALFLSNPAKSEALEPEVIS